MRHEVLDTAAEILSELIDEADEAFMKVLLPEHAHFVDALLVLHNDEQTMNMLDDEEGVQDIGNVQQLLHVFNIMIDMNDVQQTDIIDEDDEMPAAIDEQGDDDSDYVDDETVELDEELQEHLDEIQYIECDELDDVWVLIDEIDDAHIIETDEVDDYEVVTEVDDNDDVVCSENDEHDDEIHIVGNIVEYDDVQYFEIDEMDIYRAIKIDVEWHDIEHGDEYMIFEFMQKIWQIVELFIDVDKNDVVIDEQNELQCILYIQVSALCEL